MDSSPIIFIPHKQLAIPRDTGQYIVAGPKTFRRACRKLLSNKNKKLPFANFGGNRQNIDKKMRKVWQADPGYLIINRDQSGADAKIVAYLCRPGAYRDLFIYGIKPHLYLALHLFPAIVCTKFDAAKVAVAIQTPVKDLKSLEFWPQLAKVLKDSDNWAPKIRIYYFGKKVGHAGNYGMHGKKLIMVILEETQAEIVLTHREGEEWLDRYHGFFPEIRRDFQARVERQAKLTNQLRNLFGFPFNITSPIDPGDMNDLYAWIPQATVASLNAHVFILLQDYIEDNDRDWHILADTHDSITLEAPEKEAEEAATRLREFYESYEFTSPVDGVKFRMQTECQIGRNWAPYDPDDNPEGLQEVKL